MSIPGQGLSEPDRLPPVLRLLEPGLMYTVGLPFVAVSFEGL